MTQVVALSPFELFSEMEDMAVNAAAKIMSGRDELAVAIHKIYTEKLYTHALDENGAQLYPNQTAYEPHLLKKLGISRATLYNNYTPAKIACGPTMELEYKEFIETGGVTTWSGVKDNVNYNRNSGEIKGLVAGDVPEDLTIKEFVMEAVKDVSPGKVPELNLQPGEVRDQLDTTLSAGEKPIIKFSLMYELGCVKTKYSMERGERTYVGVVGTPECPQEVMTEYKKRLRIY
jgi:hypothetical protein